MNDPNCEPFELDALRASRAALPPERAARLAEHVRGCDSCRRFAEVTRATESALRGRASSALKEPARAALESRVRDGRQRIVRSAVLVVLIVALESWSRGASSALFSGSMVLLVAAAGILFHVLPQRRRLLAASSAVDGRELIAGLRSEIERDLDAYRRLRSMRILYWALVVLAAGYALVRMSQAARVESKSLALLALAAVLAARLWHDARRRLPELRRQHEDLS